MRGLPGKLRTGFRDGSQIAPSHYVVDGLMFCFAITVDGSPLLTTYKPKLPSIIHQVEE